MNATLTETRVTKSEDAVTAMQGAMSSFGRTTIADMLTQQEQLMAQAKDAVKIEDSAVRAAQLEIINSKSDSLLAKMGEYREDTAELVAGLEATFAKLGYDLSQLQKAQPEDLRIVDSAKKHLAALDLGDGTSAAAQQLSTLLAAVDEAQTGWNPIGKAGRIAEATQQVDLFNAQNAIDIAAAKVAVEESQAEVERLRRKRIRDAEFDVQFERFIALAQQIQTKLLENVQKAQTRMVETQKELEEALATKETLAKDIAEQQQVIISVENEVMTSESAVASAATQEERAALEVVLGAATQRLADLNGRKQEMEVAYNSYESAAKKHETMLRTLQTQCDNQRSHARKLSIDSKSRFVDARNLVVVIQNTAQEDAASRLHAAGSVLDRTSVEIAARSLIASERARLEMFQGHERAMQGYAEITGALAEGRAGIAIEDAEIAARMQKNFGIDPLASSWLHIAEKIGSGEDLSAAA